MVIPVQLLLQQNSWLNFTNANRLGTAHFHTGEARTVLGMSEGDMQHMGHTPEGSGQLLCRYRSAGVQDKLCFKACQRDDNNHFGKKSPTSDSLVVFPPSIVAERSHLGKRMMRRMKTSREDRRDDEEQREPSLGDTKGKERRCTKVAEQQQQGKNTQASLLCLILQVSCSRKNTSKYGKPFTLHPAAGSSSLAFGSGPSEGPLSREGRFPHTHSVPEPGLTHCPRMSVHYQQQPQTAPICALCPTHGFPLWRGTETG